jgi:hypothetical protein
MSNYGSIILKELIEEVKSMSTEEYNKLYDESCKHEDVKIILKKILKNKNNP